MPNPIAPDIGRAILQALQQISLNINGLQVENSLISNNINLNRREISITNNTSNQIYRVNQRIERTTTQIFRNDDPRIFQRLQQILRETGRLLQEAEATREEIEGLEELLQNLTEQVDGLFEDIRILNQVVERNHQASVASFSALETNLENLERTFLDEARVLLTNITRVRTSLFALRRGFFVFRVQTRNQLDGINQQLRVGNRQLRILGRRFSNVERTLGNIERNFAQLNRSLNGITQTLAGLEENIQVINRIVSATATEVGTIGEAVIAIATEIGTLGVALEVVGDGVAGLYPVIAAVEGSVLSNGFGIAANRTLIEVEFFFNKRRILSFESRTFSKLQTLQTDVSYIRTFTQREFHKVDSKLNKIDTNLAKVDKRFQKVDEDLKDIKKEFSQFTKKVDNIEKKIDDLPEKTSDQVSYKVVGESYFRYDSTSSFYPTILFRYKEDIDGPYARVSQMKMKLKKKSQEITEQDIRFLKNQCQLIQTVTYNWGSLRGNYVSKDKRFKTTIFAESQENIKRILQTLMPLVQEPFDENNLTFTIGRRRESVTKRTTPLAGIPLNPVDYQTPVVQKLFRVFLQVNGLKQPIQIFPM